MRAAVRVPFTRIIPTALSVIDTTNDSSSGAGCAVTHPEKMGRQHTRLPVVERCP